jgi:excisionase family DNA binding protein
VREFLDKQEAGAIVGLNPKTIERAILRGDLRAYKPAGKVRIRRSDLDAWIDAAAVRPSVHDI